MKKAMLLTACLIIGVSVFNAAFATPLDLRDASANQVVILPVPPKEGEVTAKKILLPEFTKACFFAGDAPDFRWVGASNRILPWIADKELKSLFGRAKKQNPTVDGPNKRSITLLFQLTTGEYLVLLPLAGPQSISWLEVNEMGELILDYGSAGKGLPEEGPIPLIAWARSDDVYTAFRDVWAQTINAEPILGRVHLRNDKVYPEAFDYLGWCSWEQYHKGINEQILVSAMEAIDASGLPIRWMLIDDGHTIVHKNALVSVEPDPKKFPNGWEPVLSRRREDGIRWIGNWHTLLGYWGNISVNHTMPELSPYLMPHPGKGDVLVPRNDPEASRAFYQHFVDRIKKQGFDFIKVDNMSRSLLEYQATENAAYAHTINLRSMEEATHALDIPLMNCSAQNTIGMLNTKYSSTMRVSIDYQRGKPATSKSHIYQSFADTLWVGQTLWPDHDMFHSSDLEVSEAMAITKAMSGGPVYVSDTPGDFAHEYIRPLCYEDGLVLRPLAPGVPLPDSVLLDALNDTSHPYTVVAPLLNRSVAIAAFNLVHPTPAMPVKGKITPNDYRNASGMMLPYPGPWSVPEEGVVAYDWKTRQGTKLDEEGLVYMLEGFAHKLFLLCPIEKGWAVIGRSDKYLAPVAVEIQEVNENLITVRLHESGPLVVYSAYGPVHADGVVFEAIGQCFYRCDLPVTQSRVTLKITR